MIRGSSTEIPSESGPAGMHIPDFTLGVRELCLALDLASDSLVDLAGDGDTGGSVGMALGSCSTVAHGCLIAEFSRIADSITAVDFMAEADFMGAGGSTAVPALTPERLADLIMEEQPEASLLAGNRASVEAFTGAGVSTAAEAVVTGNKAQLLQGHWKIVRENSCIQII